MKSSFQWNGDAILHVGVDAAWEGIVRAALHYARAVKLALNVPNTGTRVRFTDRATGRRRTRTVYANPSRPGEPPRKITGNLQANVLHELDRERLTARVGVGQNARYGLFLEFGTRVMAARPFLHSTLVATWPELQALVNQARD